MRIPGPTGEPCAHVSGLPGLYLGHRIEVIIDRQRAVEAFAAYVRYWARYAGSRWHQESLAADLAGRDLGCWCPLPAPGEYDWCHAHALLALANGWPVDRESGLPCTHPVGRMCTGCGTDEPVAGALGGVR